MIVVFHIHLNNYLWLAHLFFHIHINKLQKHKNKIREIIKIWFRINRGENKHKKDESSHIAPMKVVINFINLLIIDQEKVKEQITN